MFSKTAAHPRQPVPIRPQPSQAPMQMRRGVPRGMGPARPASPQPPNQPIYSNAPQTRRNVENNVQRRPPSQTPPKGKVKLQTYLYYELDHLLETAYNDTDKVNDL